MEILLLRESVHQGHPVSLLLVWEAAAHPWYKHPRLNQARRAALIYTSRIPGSPPQRLTAALNWTGGTFPVLEPGTEGSTRL